MRNFIAWYFAVCLLASPLFYRKLFAQNISNVNSLSKVNSVNRLVPSKFTLGVTKECLPDNETDELFFRRTTGKGDLKNLNVKCDHQMLLREGNTIYVAYDIFITRQNELVQKENDLTKLQNEGACTAQEKLDECKRRWSRTVLDSNIQTRHHILNNNKTRIDLLPSEETLNAGKVVELNNNSKSQKQNQVIKDIYDYSRMPTNQKKQMMVPGVSAINFNQNNDSPEISPGDAILNPQNFNRKKADFKNNIDKDLVNNGSLEYATDQDDKGALSSSINQKTLLLKKAAQKDQLKYAKEVELVKTGKKFRSPGAANQQTTGEEALKDTMDRIKAAADLKKQNLEDSSVSYPSESMDKDIQEAVKNSNSLE